tara:strand:+ start:465 stop:1652 length:1188 start_codon:yes stop_codon:yes gene_type:complete
MALALEAWRLRVDHVSYTSPTNQPDDNYLKMLQQIVERDDSILKVTVLPNWSYSWLNVPDGFIVEFDAAAPFKADLFFCNMWAGSCVAEAKNVDESKLHDASASLNRAIKGPSVNPPQLDTADTKYWQPSLGNNDNYIGLYSCDRINPKTQMTEKMYCVVADTSIDDAVYGELEAYFEECERRGMSYREVFYNNRKTEKLRTLVTRNRRALVYEFAQVLGIDVTYRKYTKAVHELNIAQYLFETEYNKVKFEEGNTKMIFYRGSTTTDDIQKALIFSRGPLQGPMIYVGPKANKESKALFNGLRWKNDLWNAFPTHMGRNVAASDWSDVQRRLGIATSELQKRLLIDVAYAESEFFLHSFPYKERDEGWRSVETKLGYSYATHMVPLRPLIVKIS